MDDSKKYLLLDVVFRNGSVARLTREGISFTDIAIYTEEAIKQGLITNSEKRLILTQAGIDLLKKLGSKYKKTNKDQWIEKDLKYQIPKLEKNAIFVPRQDELTF